jgi:large subunit ribosomal protein L31
MKKGIHPKYHDDAKITCFCGAELETGSTQKEMNVEICSQCHPFYTGKKKMLDSTGRVDRFKKMTERAQAKKEALKSASAMAKSKASKKVKAEKEAEKTKKKPAAKKTKK